MPEITRLANLRWLEYHDPQAPEGEPAEQVFTAVIDNHKVAKGGWVLAVNRSDREWDVYVRTSPGSPHGEPIATVPANTSMRVWGRLESEDPL